MPWKCPACSTPIRQQLTAAGDESPRPGRIYHCDICHLGVTLNPDADTMIIAPLSADRPDDVRRSKS